jgi:ABC transport system ATP-binding/permease protein
LRIEKLELEIASLHEKLSGHDFYQSDPDGFFTASKRLITAQEELTTAENRWLELDEMRQS